MGMVISGNPCPIYVAQNKKKYKELAPCISHKCLERKEGHCYVNLAAMSNLLHLIQIFHSKFFEKQPRKPLAMAPLWHL